MDLKNISLDKVEFEITFKDDDVNAVENGGIVCGHYIENMNIGFDIFRFTNTNRVNVFFGNLHEENYGNVFFHYKIILSNEKTFEECFWNYRLIQFMNIEQLRAWQAPRKIIVKVKRGMYTCTRGDEWDLKNILTNVKDFEPVCSPPTFHTNFMDNLLESCFFSDVTLLCIDKKSISTHRCLLKASPYFHALFGSNFFKSHQKVVNVEFDYLTMKMLVTFLYSGRVQEEAVVNWPELFLAANFYQIRNLARHCELQMMTRVAHEWDTIKELIMFARTFHAFKMKKFLIKLARKIQAS